MNVKVASRTFAVAILLAALPSWAQAPNLNPKVPPEQQIPVVKFEFALPGGSPPHYALSVEAGGAAAYRGDPDPEAGPNLSGDNEPYFLKFDLSPKTADRIFSLAKDLNFFQGDFEYHGGKLANMGAKTFTFKDGKRNNSFTYNYSQNPQLQQLTSLMQGIASAVEFRRQLERLYRYEKLGLQDVLSKMTDAVKNGYVSDLEIDEPILRQIANDTTIMNISRRQAEKMLAKVGKQ